MSLKFCQYFKPISISLSPNTEKDDVLLALKLLFQPLKWKWKKKETRSPFTELEKEFKEYLGVHHAKCPTETISPKAKLFNGVKYAISFNSGRSTLMAILDSFQNDNFLANRGRPPVSLTKGDEILLQAFTCNAVVNPILWAGLKPVFVDCDEKTFNIDCEDLKRKITPRSKVVIVQHTFGLPAKMDEILGICQTNNLILIEDCAHSLGAGYKGRKVGTFGKVAFFSFSRDKIISSVYGGMAITNDKNLAKKIKDYWEKIDYPSYFWIKQQLLHPIFMNWLILPSYRFFGKYLLILFQWLHFLSKAVHWKEKRGLKPDYFPKKLPEALASLALNQFKKLERFNEHRQKIALFYYDEIIKKCPEFIEGLPISPADKKQTWLRFTIKHPRAHEIIKKSWQKNILIGDWYTSPIAPKDTRLEKIGYKLGSCPNAEKLSETTFNLPTHINISIKDAQKIVDFLKNYYQAKREE
jgi:dTDP-4-amino-4,6-dideoxygalactose transaminase